MVGLGFDSETYGVPSEVVEHVFSRRATPQQQVQQRAQPPKKGPRHRRIPLRNRSNTFRMKNLGHRSSASSSPSLSSANLATSGGGGSGGGGGGSAAPETEVMSSATLATTAGDKPQKHRPGTRALRKIYK